MQRMLKMRSMKKCESYNNCKLNEDASNQKKALVRKNTKNSETG